MNIVINPKYRDALPPLPAESLQQLRDSITEEGIRDKIIVCEGTGEIVDGHNRYAIATELGLDVPINYREFADEDAILDFIYANALSRRNLTPEQTSLYRGRLYEIRKRADKGHGSQEDSVNVGEQVAEQFGVSRATVMRDGKLAAAVEELAAPLKDAFESGAMKMSNAQAIELSKLPKAEQLQKARQVRTGQSTWDNVLPKKPKKQKVEPEQKKPPKSAPAPVEQTTEERMEEWNEEVEDLAKRVAACVAKGSRPSGPWCTDVRWSLITDSADALIKTIRQMKGYGECSACEGKGCKHCLKTGFAPKVVLDSLGAKK